jgi:hypothetical protein
MRHPRVLLPIAVFAVVVGCLVVPLYCGEPAIGTDDLVAKHLDAIGSKDARGAAKSCAVQGAATYHILVGGGGTLEGKTGIVSDGRKVRFMMKFPNDYRGETFVSNGEKAQIFFSNTNQSLSPIAGFVSAYDVMVRDGLIGGVLSTNWALMDLSERKAKLVFEGLKKEDGKQLYRMRYEPNKHIDVQIFLYFEPDTYRHVKTVYDLQIGNNGGRTIVESSRLQAERSRLEEKFSDFKTVDGLTLPTHWNIQFTREKANGSTTVSEWDLKEEQIAHNVGLDARNFEVK